MAKRRFHFTKEELYEEYVIKDKSTHMIAKEKGCSSEVVQRNLRDFNIKARNNKEVYQHKIRNSKLFRDKVSKGLNFKGRATSTKGYKLIYCPNHPFATKTKYVFEHRLMAEKKLGRYLKPKEEVHHIDFDISNNSLDNLHVFKNKSEHTAYHNMLRNSIKQELINEVF